MPTGLTLNTSASVVLDDAGNGQASAGPPVPGVVWHPKTIAVSAELAGGVVNNEAQCSVFLGVPPPPGQDPAAGSLLGATQTGSSGDSTDCDADVYPGQQITAVWTGGDHGATATISIFGTKDVP